ncbi:MAG: 1-acyl-sn-glycerol-3-phosphate acyltransferase, partial [Candidatus Brocadiae bacterium]|nr:1-acyl-sn-glycerol-3-phosphate acyltransferase [Candidatus Brocadiia bacterium]
MNKKRYFDFFFKILQCSFIAIVILALYGWYKLELNTDILKLLPETPSLKNLQKYNQIFSSLNRIAITLVHKEKKEQDLIKAGDRAIELLKANPYFANVQARLDMLSGAEVKKFYEEQMPNFLELKDFEKISQKIAPENVEKRLSSIWEQQIGIAPTSSNVRIDPLQFSELFWKKLSWEVDIYQGYLLSKDHKALLIQVPSFPKQLNHEENIRCWDFLKETKQKLNAEFPGIDMIAIGGQRIAIDNQKRMISDVKLTSFLTIVALCLLFWGTLRNFFFFPLFLLPSFFGMFVGIGICNLCSSQLSLLTLGYGSIVIGITIDHGIHYFTHIGAAPSITPIMIIRNILKPLSFSMISTCGAMMILSFSSFPAYVELGLFIASGVLGSFLFVVVLYPKISESMKKKNIQSIFKDFPDFLKKLEQAKWVKIGKAFMVLSVVVLAAISIPKISKMEFVTNLEQFSYRSQETQQEEEKFFSIWGDQRGKIAIVVQGKSFEEALEKNDAVYSHLQSAAKKNELKIDNLAARLLPSLKRMQSSHEMWKSYWTKEKQEHIKNSFHSSHYGFSSRAFAPFFQQISNPSQPRSMIELWKNTAFSALFQDSVVAKENHWYIQNIIQVKDAASIDRLYEAIEKAAPDTILVDRMQILKTTDSLLKREIFWTVVGVSLFLLLILKLYFVYLEMILCNFLPLCLSIVCTLGILDICGIPVDLFNVLVIIFILALGIDYTVFHTCSYLSTGGVKSSTRTSNTSVVLCSVTTILGFGSLVFAEHPALYSLGFCSIVGVNMAWINSLFITPIFLHFFLPPDRKSHAIHFYHLIPTFWSAIGYFFGFITLSTIVFPAIAFWQKITGKYNKIVYLRIIEYLNKRVLSIGPFGKIVHHNFPPREKILGCVVASNHLNTADIPAFNSLPCDKITIVKWFWKIPFVGAVLKMAGFIPIQDTQEISYNNPHIEYCKKALAEKINVFFFPEGTRVHGFKMQRFHQGAFVLACEEKIPVLPVCFFNSRWIFPKGRFIVRDFEMIASALPFINT